jgi:two-component system nitrogen regulation response regulator GlnG
LEQAVAAGQFREDLFYRLNGVRLHMPPLRERNGDIPLLILYFLHKIARQQQPPQPPKSIASSAVKALEKYSWPGNVRELESVMRRAAVISGEVILTKDLPPEITGEADAAAVLSVLDAQAGAVDEISTLARQLFLWARREPKLKVIAAVERELIIHALKETKGNQVHAAKLLGMTRATLRKRLEKFEIQRELSIK